jgi:hypothetical protein
MHKFELQEREIIKQRIVHKTKLYEAEKLAIIAKTS